MKTLEKSSCLEWVGIRAGAVEGLTPEGVSYRTSGRRFAGLGVHSASRDGNQRVYNVYIRIGAIWRGSRRVYEFD